MGEGINSRQRRVRTVWNCYESKSQVRHMARAALCIFEMWREQLSYHADRLQMKVQRIVLGHLFKMRRAVLLV